MGDLGPGMLDPGGSLAPRDEIKTQFMTREGTYQVQTFIIIMIPNIISRQLMTLAEYSRPNRVGYANQAANTSAPVKVSFVPGAASSTGEPGPEAGEKIAFNYGRELFVYPYKGHFLEKDVEVKSYLLHTCRREKGCGSDKTHRQESVQRNLSDLPRLRPPGLPQE